MTKRRVSARDYAMSFVGDVSDNIPYTKLAKKVAIADKKVVTDIDLDNKDSAIRFLVTWHSVKTRRAV